MKAIWHGQVIAESDRTLEVDGYRYFPRESVRMDLLHVAPKTQTSWPRRRSAAACARICVFTPPALPRS